MPSSGVVALLLVTSITAALLPALRATRIDPRTVLTVE
jgi:ABC-type lipoprotein release transport system permease subunit